MFKTLVIHTLIMVSMSLATLFYFDPAAGLGMLNSLFRMAIATSIMLLLLRLLDRRLGISFNHWWRGADAKTKGMYFSARIVAVSLIVCACMA